MNLGTFCRASRLMDEMEKIKTRIKTIRRALYDAEHEGYGEAYVESICLDTEILKMILEKDALKLEKKEKEFDEL